MIKEIENFVFLSDGMNYKNYFIEDLHTKKKNIMINTIKLKFTLMFFDNSLKIMKMTMMSMRKDIMHSIRWLDYDYFTRHTRPNLMISRTKSHRYS